MMHPLTRQNFRFMFDFLFRRSAKKNHASHSSEAVLEVSSQQQAITAKLAALSQAEQYADDEPGAVAFILKCQFADARLKAAEFIHSREALEQVRNAMRNVDRRVAKLTQTQLEVIRKQELTAKEATDCITAAQKLSLDSGLTPNQASDLEKRWKLLADVPQDLRETFDESWRIITNRLTAQTALQRRVMDALAKIREIGAASASLTPDEMARLLDDLSIEIGEFACAPELHSLPKSMLPAFQQEFDRLRELQSAHERSYQALQERERVLEGWESEVDSLDWKQIEKQWSTLAPADNAAMVPLQERFNALIGRIREREASQKSQSQQKIITSPKLSNVIDAMEQALNEGSLHAAAEHDAVLRSLDVTVMPEQSERIGRLRSELKRLQDWARWSGRVSREELLREVEELPAKSLQLDELAAKVVDARKTWKLLDSSSGAASRAQWQQFDEACNRAYEPVAEHARKLGAEREQNAAAAQVVIDAVKEFIAKTELNNPSGIDWKNVSGFYRKAQKSWRELGPMDRKDRKRLESEFAETLKSLRKPLEEQWREETTRREQLIEKVQSLNPTDRAAPDTVKQIQEQWQESARAIPLGNREEQELWKRFRSACDGLFAKRKEASDSVGEERRRNLAGKEAICAKLEGAVSEPVERLHGILRDANAEWNAAGHVSGGAERAIQERYHAAIASLQERIDAAKNEARHATVQALSEKLALCCAAEAALTGRTEPDITGWNLHWNVLPSLDHRHEKMLRSRFDAAMEALTAGDKHYPATLESNQALLLKELLHLEIIHGMDSPEEFAAERRQMQIEMLQDSLAGNKEESVRARIDAICSLPAPADEQTVARLNALLRRDAGI